MVIHDQAEFVRRLAMAMFSAVNAKPLLKPVQYYDLNQVRHEKLKCGKLGCMGRGSRKNPGSARRHAMASFVSTTKRMLKPARTS